MVVSDAQAEVGGLGEFMRESMIEESMTFIGFRMEHVSPQRVEGRFVVNKNSSQAFGVLNGGISALVAESLASYGAHIVAGYKRVAGIELNINHFRAAPIGTEIFVSAEPIQAGKRIQVWDVTFYKVAPSEQKADVNTKLAVARVTLMAGLTGQTIDRSGQERRIQARL